MGIANIHGIYAVGFGSTVLGGITRASLPTGSEVRGEPTDGNPYNRFISLVGQRLRASFTSIHIPAALNAIALDGKNIVDLVGGLSFYGYQHKDGSTREAGAAHKKYGFARGLVVPRTLTVSHQDDAEFNAESFITYDGINQPLILTENVAVPAVVAAPTRHTIGPITIGGIAIRQVRSVTVDFGVTVKAEGSDSEIWESHASVASIQPMITIRGVDLHWLSDTKIPLLGKAAAHVDTTIYLRSRITQSTFHADGVPSHIKITASGIATISSPFDASGNEAGEATLELKTMHDGTNAPLLINTASQIT